MNHVEQVGPYQVLEEIGRGGMATVYKVLTPRGNTAALKLLHINSLSDPRWGTRFQREFRLLSRLRHPHLIKVHDYGEERDQIYYVMDYIQGMTLWDFYRDHLRGAPIQEKLRWVLPLTSQIVSALDYIHRHRVIHQDLKPANVLLKHDAQTAYLADFGLAREVKKGTFQYTHAGFIGTLGYAAPEIIERARLDGRADLYSLGVILYTVLADRRPVQVEGRSLEDLVNSILYEAPVPIQEIVPDIPPAMAALVHKCIPKAPNERYRNTRELWKDLLQLLASQQQSTTMHAPVPEFQQESHSKETFLFESSVIGRNEEIDLCQKRINRLAQHRASGVSAFYGIPGIGKSFLLEEIGRMARRYQLNVYTYKLRPQATPYSALSKLLRPILETHPPHKYMSTNYQVLASYLPGLSTDATQSPHNLPTLLDPISELSALLDDLLRAILPKEGQVWLIDDLHNADTASQNILRTLMLKQRSSPQHPLYVVVSICYAPGGRSPSFKLPQHEKIDSSHLLPFSEEEENQYIEQMLGRSITPAEYEQIRQLSRGIPLRTYELIHHNHLQQEPSLLSLQQNDSQHPNESEYDINSPPSSRNAKTTGRSFETINPFERKPEIANSQSQKTNPEQPTVFSMLASLQPDNETQGSAPSDLEEATAIASQIEIVELPQSINQSTDEDRTHHSPEVQDKRGLGKTEPFQIAIQVPSEDFGYTEENEMEATMLGMELSPLLSPVEATQRAKLPPKSQDDIDKPQTASSQELHKTTTSSPRPTNDDALRPPLTFFRPPNSGEKNNSPATAPPATPLRKTLEVAAFSIPSNSLQAAEESGGETMKGALDMFGLAPEQDSTAKHRIQTLENKLQDTTDGPTAFFSSADFALALAEQKAAEASPRPDAPPAIPQQQQQEPSEASNPQRPGSPVPGNEKVSSPRDADALSEETVLVSLYERRLEVLGSEQQQILAHAALLADTFTARELYDAAQITMEAALDLLNQCLSLRIVEIHSVEQEELYAFLQPTFRRLLIDKIPASLWPQLAERAANAMISSRKDYHLHHNPSLLASRLSEAHRPVEALYTHIHTVKNALHSQLEEACKTSLLLLQQQLRHWTQQNATGTLHQSLSQIFPEFRSEKPSKREILEEQLLWAGILRSLQMETLALQKAQQAHQTWRELQSEVTSESDTQLQRFRQRLLPLFDFAQLKQAGP